MTLRDRLLGVWPSRRRLNQMNDLATSAASTDQADANAADWVVRLSSPEDDAADWAAFEAWLQANPANGPAYDAALATWTAYTDHREALLARAQMPGRRRALAARRGGGAHRAFWGAAIAASLALVVGGAMWNFTRPSPPEIYETARGERRSIVLEDGSRLEMNGASRISVRFGRTSRDVQMADGEVAFDVAHDESRPFKIAVADRTIQVVGTQFNVLRTGEALAITVRRGLVKVESGRGGAGDVIELPAGRQLVVDAQGGQQLRRPLDVNDAFSWETGRLIYRNQPLPVVVSDLNRYFAKPVRLEGQAAQSLRFSGVLMTGKEDEVIGALSDILSLSSHEADGVITLNARGSER